MNRVTEQTITLLLLSLLASCSSNQEPVDFDRQPVVLKAEIFTIGSDVATVWSGGQAVGVYMVKSSTDELVYANMKHFADNRGTTGYMVPDGNVPMYYPDDGSEVEFKVYYPYDPDASGSTVATRAVEAYTEVRVDEHTAPDGFLYSRNAKGSNANTEASTVQIKSMLSQVSIDFNCNLDGASKLEAHIKNISTRARFDLMQGMFVEYSTEEDAVLPMTGTKQTVGGNTVFSMSAVILSGVVPEEAELELVLTYRDEKNQEVVKKYNPIALKQALDLKQEGAKAEENTQYNITASLTESDDVATVVESKTAICIYNWAGASGDPDEDVARPENP